MKNNKILLVAYAIVLITMPIKDIGIAHVVGKIIESLRSNEISYKYIYVLIGLVSIVQVGQALNDIIEIKIFPLFQKFICNKILDYVFSMSSTNLQEILNGKILSIMAHGPRTMYNYVDIWRTDIMPQIIVFIITFIYLFFINNKLAFVFLTVIIIYYYIAYSTMDKCNEPSRVRESYLIKVNEEVDDVLMNVVGILNANQKDNEFGNLNKYYDKYQKYGELSMICTMKYKFILMPFLLASLVCFIYIGYVSVIEKKLKLEKFIVSVIIYLYIFNSILKTIDEFRNMSIRGGMVKEHLKIFESMEQAIENTSPINNIYHSKYIYFDNINFNYGNKRILNNFSLEIKKNEKLLIIGQIGSGKTTILKLLMRYNNPISGHIYYNGAAIDTIPRKNLRKKIGYIPQNPILLNRTLYENITYGNSHITKEQVIGLIRMLQIEHIFSYAKFDEYVGKHGSKLSGGQRQVVWILRVLVQNPEILVMDEPTSAIDKDTKIFIDHLFELVMKNRTVIIVSHDEYMSKLCDRTIIMQAN